MTDQISVFLAHHTTSEVLVCNSCTIVATNGDLTHICDCTTQDEHFANECGGYGIEASVSMFTTDSPTGTSDPDGYWDCFACSSTHLGRANTYDLTNR